MKLIITVLGVLLLVLGIISLVYHGISYTKKDKLAQIGDVKITADTQKKIYLSPMLGGILLLVGAALVLIGVYLP